MTLLPGSSRTSEDATPSPAGPGAGFLDRLVAFYIDAKIFILAAGLIGMGLVACGLPEAVAGALFPVLFLTYHALLNSDLRQTPGKWIVGIRVVAADGTPLSKRDALKRGAAYFLSGLPLGLGFLPALFRADKRAWHDRLAGSRVAEARPRGTLARVLIIGAALLIITYNVSAIAGYFYHRGLARAERLSYVQGR